MKKILTAIGNQKLNQELRKYENLEVICSDVQYKEGILEILEQNNDIDLVIINEEIQGQLDIEQLINTIKIINKNIEIVIIIKETKEEKINYLNRKNIKLILFKEKYNVENLINYILKNLYNVEKDFSTQKEMLIKETRDNNIVKIKNEILFNRIRYFINRIKIKVQKKEMINKIITISGIGGVGKSIFTINLAKAYANEKNRILIIDFDVKNNCIHTLCGRNMYSKEVKNNIDFFENINTQLLEKSDITKYVVKFNKKIDILTGIDKIVKSINELEELIHNIKNIYNIILIDTSTDCFFEFTKYIMKNSEEILFLSEGNLIQIKKSINLLNKFTNEWTIDKQKINIIINKKTKESIDENILENIFSDYYIIGKIKFSKIYNIIINKNMSDIYYNNKLKKEYKKISQEILKNNNIYKYDFNKKERK